MKTSVFEYKNYRDYLRDRLSTTGTTRGLRSRLAELTGTQPAYISRVLNADVHLSPEHVPPANELFGHTEEEGHFFMLLVLHGRAGTKALEKYVKKQIDEILAKRSVFMERVKIENEIPPADQALYYSQWYYLAIHLLVGIPGYQTKEALGERLDLPPQLISKAIDQLIAMGLIDTRGGKLITGKNRIHVDKNSPWVSQMHAQFRNRGIYRLSNPESNDLHFSFGMGISKKVFEEYRRRLMDLVVEFEPKLTASSEEDLFALNIDLFRF